MEIEDNNQLDPEAFDTDAPEDTDILELDIELPTGVFHTETLH